ncbi:MAG: hypothetical protein WC055_13160 [Melioribacteraceae bacterium]
MRNIIKEVNNIIQLFGLNIKKMILSFKEIPHFYSDLKKIKSQIPPKAPFPITKIFPCLIDRVLESGTAKGHYFHQDLVIARRIFQNQPTKHIDIGSRIDGFVAHVATFRPIIIMDVRNLKSDIRNIEFVQMDLMEELSEEFEGFCDSISSLHAIEHFGLGRYGDSVNYNGHLIGFDNIYKMLKKMVSFIFQVQ